MPRPIQISLRRFGLNHPTNIIERIINFRNGRSLQCSSLLFSGNEIEVFRAHVCLLCNGTETFRAHLCLL